MAESTYEFTGKSVDEAVAEALAQLKVSRSEVAVEVLSKGSRGIFGLGSEPARVRVTLAPAPTPASEESADAGERSEASAASSAVAAAESSDEQQPDAAVEEVGEVEEVEVVETVAETPTDEGEDEATAEEDEAEGATERALDIDGSKISDEELAVMASEMLSEIVRLMGFSADIVSSWKEPDDDSSAAYLVLDIEGDDLGALIGRRGETLASLQYLVRLMVNQRIKQWRNIVVDVEKYKERRESQLNQLALRMADQVSDSGRAMALEPMPPNERRIVHLALRDHELVYTQSSGEGDRRKVNIVPRDTA